MDASGSVRQSSKSDTTQLTGGLACRRAGRGHVAAIAALVALVAVALAITGSAVAGKKGGGSTPPPPPPGNPFQIYEDRRADLGGWLDTERNLVWGYALYETSATGTSFAYSGATWTIGRYADWLFEQIAELEELAAYYEARGSDFVEKGYAAQDAGDAELAERYFTAAERDFALAQDCRDSKPLYFDAAATAGQYNNWRLPTLEEGVDACAKGLFTYGEGGFNGYDASPFVGVQEGGNYSPRWTSDTEKVRGTWCAWVFRTINGETYLRSQASGGDGIVVRTHVP